MLDGFTIVPVLLRIDINHDINDSNVTIIYMFEGDEPDNVSVEIDVMEHHGETRYFIDDMTGFGSRFNLGEGELLNLIIAEVEKHNGESSFVFSM